MSFFSTLQNPLFIISILLISGRVPIWPYTLYFRMPHKCNGNAHNCPSKSHPVWEMVMNELDRRDDPTFDESLPGCHMVDSCSNIQTGDQFARLLRHNFNRHFNSNRAPLGEYWTMRAACTFTNTVCCHCRSALPRLMAQEQEGVQRRADQVHWRDVGPQWRLLRHHVAGRSRQLEGGGVQVPNLHKLWGNTQQKFEFECQFLTWCGILGPETKDVDCMLTGDPMDAEPYWADRSAWLPRVEGEVWC